MVANFQYDPFFFTNPEELSVPLADVMAKVNSVQENQNAEGHFDNIKVTLYELSDNHFLYFDDSDYHASLSLVHPCDISWYTLLFSRNDIAAEIQSLIHPGGDGARDINEPIVAEALAATDTQLASLPGLGSFTFESKRPVRAIWNGVGKRAPKDVELNITDPKLWTGELFKEVPDRGADLVALFLSETSLEVWRISVKLGNANSVIKADKNKKKSAAQSAAKQIADLLRIHDDLSDRLTDAATKKGLNVRFHYALATVRHVQPGAKAVFEKYNVEVWDRSTLAPRWPKRLAKTINDNKCLVHYREPTKTTPKTAASKSQERQRQKRNVGGCFAQSIELTF